MRVKSRERPVKVRLLLRRRRWWRRRRWKSPARKTALSGQRWRRNEARNGRRDSRSVARESQDPLTLPLYGKRGNRGASDCGAECRPADEDAPSSPERRPIPTPGRRARRWTLPGRRARRSILPGRRAKRWTPPGTETKEWRKGARKLWAWSRRIRTERRRRITREHFPPDSHARGAWTTDHSL